MTRHRRHRLAALLLVLLVPLAGGLATAPARAATADGRPAGPGAAADRPGGFILVAEAEGLLDPVSVDLLERTVREGERTGAALVVVTVNSIGAVDVDIDRLIDAVATARVPIAVWVGGAGAHAEGAAVLLLEAGHVAAMAPGARLGRATPLLLSHGAVTDRAKVGRRLATLAALRSRPAARAATLVRAGTNLSGRQARARRLVDVTAPTLRDLIATLDGRRVVVAGRSVTLDLGTVVGGQRQEKQVVPVRFRKLTLTEQMSHALTSPFVAYLLLMLGLCLAVFEFFAVGIGLAAMAGALLVVASFVGLSHLPVNAVAFGMLIAGFLALAVDVQAGRPAFWAAVGTALVGVGSWRLYAGSSLLDPPWWQVLLVIVGALLFLLPGLAAVIRSRFSTPTIGRESMVGEVGTARAALSPEGVVEIRGALWKARATRASDLQAGDPVRVTAIVGLTLEVEPVEDEVSTAR